MLYQLSYLTPRRPLRLKGETRRMGQRIQSIGERQVFAADGRAMFSRETKASAPFVRGCVF